MVDNYFRMENSSRCCRSDMSQLNPLMRSPTSALTMNKNYVWRIPASLSICCEYIRMGAPVNTVVSTAAEELQW